MAETTKPQRMRVERGIYRRPNGRLSSAPVTPVASTATPAEATSRLGRALRGMVRAGETHRLTEEGAQVEVLLKPSGKFPPLAATG